MRTLDRWRAEIGVVYDGEQPAAYERPLNGQPIAVRPGNAMPYVRVEHLKKDISRLALGAMSFKEFGKAAVLYDEFFARGGNSFDTAYVYGEASERMLGKWIRSRKVRDRVVVVAKGAHTPKCEPQYVGPELTESLERMGLEYADVYFLHRDNPDVPVDEWVDVLNDEAQKGRIRIFGGSNWTAERIEQANAYAAEKGKQGFSALSNQFSLARMLSPPWPGCLSSSAADFREWHQQNKFPLCAWSSQARGFFVPGADPQSDQLKPFYSEDNIERRRRTVELARKKKTNPMAVALAFVLQQPFPVVALTGPRKLSELRTTFEALRVKLSSEERAWLDLREY